MVFRRILRISVQVVATVAALLLLLWILVQIPVVQQSISGIAVQQLQSVLKTRVSVKEVRIGLLNRLHLKQVVVLDKQHDSLLQIGSLSIAITDWFPWKDTIDLTYLAASKVHVHLQRTDSVWNDAFIQQLFAGNNNASTGKPVRIRLHLAELEQVSFEQHDYWRGRHFEAGFDKLSLKFDGRISAAQTLVADALYLDAPYYREFKKKGNWTAADSIQFWQRLAYTDSLAAAQPVVSAPARPWSIEVKQVYLSNGSLRFYNRQRKPSVPGVFDERDIIITQIAGQVKQLKVNGDTITAHALLQARERSGFEIKKVDTRFTMHPQLMEFDALKLHTNRSVLGPYYAMRYNSMDDMEYFLDRVHITAALNEANISVEDIAVFAPDLKDIVQTGVLSATAAGTVSDFRVENVDLQTGNSRITGTYAMKGLIDIENTIIDFSTRGSTLDLNDLAVWAPSIRALQQTPVAQLGLLNFNGKFKGSPYDFDAGGIFNTNVGSIDASIKLKMKGPEQGYTAVIRAANVDGGKLLGVPRLHQMLFAGEVQSRGFDGTFPVSIKGQMQSFDYNNYVYRNIGVESVYEGNTLLANMLVEDPNLSGNILTALDFSKTTQRYNARGYISHADFKNLGLLQDTLLFSGDVDVDFKGNTIDEFLGYARFYNANVSDGRQRLSLDTLQLASGFLADSSRWLSLHTNEASARVEGQFNLSKLGDSFIWFLHRYYPTIIDAPSGSISDQDFRFQVETRTIDPFLRIIDRKLSGLNQSMVSGALNTRNGLLEVSAEVPQFSYGNAVFSDIKLTGRGSEDELRMQGSVANLQLKEGIQFPEGKLDLVTIRDSTRLLATTASSGPLGNAALDLNIFTLRDGFEIRFNESALIANQKKWTIGKGGNLAFRGRYLYTNGIALTQDSQRIMITSRPDEEGNWNNLFADIEQVQLGDWLPYFLTDPVMDGTVTGLVSLKDPSGDSKVSANLDVDDFYFNGDSVGQVAISGGYNSRTQQLESKIISHNPGYDFDGLVLLDLRANAPQPLNTSIRLRNERIQVLKPYLAGIMDEIDGYAEGELFITGPLNKPALTGKVLLRNGSLKPTYTQCLYQMDSATIVFGDNYIDFGALKLRDEKNRTGIAEGRMYHRWFDSLSFDVRMRTEGMQVLNTESGDNDVFYGQAVAKATFSLKGPLNNLQMRVSGTPTDSSWIAIANEEGRTSGEADYIVFREYGTEVTQVPDTSLVNYHITLDLNANPLCRVDVVLDALTGDIISATGSGNLFIQAGSVEPTVMRGRYVVEQGSYNYNFQSLIRKPFILNNDGNNYIEWNGDPYEANMHVTATYVAKDVSLRDLLANENAGTILDQDARNYKGDVLVNARLKGNLMQPGIKFEIAFPQGSVMRNNISALDMLRRISEDESENLRQVTYLIVFRSFAPFRQGAAQRNPGADLAVNTISELVSREMEKILTGLIQDLTRDRSLSVDLSTNFYNSSQTLGNVSAFSQYDRVNVNFNLNRSFYNNRVVVNLGSDFDLNVRSTAATGFQFLPDINVEFILTPNRRLRAIVFKRDNLDIAGRRNRAGASISYRKDFDKLFGRKEDEALFFTREKATDSTPPPSD